MDKGTDWRLQGQEKFLQGATLYHRQYRIHPRNPDWDHDHCAFCGGKFSLADEPDTLRRGYTTEYEYHWICQTCFNNFQSRFQWSVSQDT